MADKKKAKIIYSEPESYFKIPAKKKPAKSTKTGSKSTKKGK